MSTTPTSPQPEASNPVTCDIDSHASSQPLFKFRTPPWLAHRPTMQARKTSASTQIAVPNAADDCGRRRGIAGDCVTSGPRCGSRITDCTRSSQRQLRKSAVRRRQALVMSPRGGALRHRCTEPFPRSSHPRRTSPGCCGWAPPLPDCVPLECHRGTSSNQEPPRARS